MKTKLLLVLLFIFFVQKGSSQVPNFLWADGILQSCAVFGMVADASGNVYTTGNFSGSVDFDPGPGSYYLNGSGIFISKLDAYGHFVWAKMINAGWWSQGNAITLDSSGNIYTTGIFSGTIDFNPGQGVFNLSSTGDGIFISKLDNSGNFVWAKAFSGDLGNSNDGDGIAVDSSGNVYITGAFREIVDFDPGPGTHILNPGEFADTFVSKLDANGNLVWVKRMTAAPDDTSGDAGVSIVVDHSGNVYTTGNFAGTVDFDPGAGVFNLTTTSEEDNFISKLDNGGNFIWAKSFDATSGQVHASSMTIDNSGNIFTTGYFFHTVDFDPDSSGVFDLSTNPSGVFISKLDDSGNFVWAKSLMGSYGGVGYSITLDSHSNIYTAGSFSETIDFDPGPGIFNITSNSNSWDIFVSKLDSVGDFIWAKAAGGTESDASRSIAVDASGNVSIAGLFDSPSISFDTTIFLDPDGILNTNAFIAKLGAFDPCISTSTIAISSCDSYTSPSGQVWTVSGTYFDIIPNAAGCDSLITIHLTINSLDTWITQIPVGVLHAESQPGATYQWLDCDNNFAIIPGATGYNFTASSNGHYAVEITEGSCIDTSFCLYVFALVSIGEINSENSVSIFPNPASNHFTISLNNYKKAEVTISDITGKIIYATTVREAQQLEINTKNFAEGVYIVQVKGEEFVETKKVLITHQY
jgi:hypothetical protein